MIFDVQEHLARLLEPDESITKMILDKPPTVFEADHLYVYPARVDEVPFESGPTRKQDFILNIVLVVDDMGEMASMEPDEELAQKLDEKRGDYLRIVRVNQVTTVWDHLRGLVDSADPLPMDKRSAAVRVSGWRIVN